MKMTYQVEKVKIFPHTGDDDDELMLNVLRCHTGQMKGYIYVYFFLLPFFNFILN